MADNSVSIQTPVAGSEAPVTTDNNEQAKDPVDPLGSSTSSHEESSDDGGGQPQEQQKEEAKPEEGEAQKSLKEQLEAQKMELAKNATKDQAAEAVKDAGLDFGVLEQEYMANGGLSDESYAKLEKAGIGRQYVDAYINGQAALLDNFINEVTSAAGGRDKYNEMTKWALDNYSKDDIDAYNKVMNSGDKAMIRMAVSALVTRYRSAEGAEPTLVKGRQSSGGRPHGGSYASAEEMVEAMKDPRYGKDPAYTREVERKVNNSNFFG